MRHSGHKQYLHFLYLHKLAYSTMLVGEYYYRNWFSSRFRRHLQNGIIHPFGFRSMPILDQNSMAKR